MKNFYIIAGVAATGLVIVGLGLSNAPLNHNAGPDKAEVSQRAYTPVSEQLTELVYLPDNTCRFVGGFDAASDDYRDIVKSCIELRHREMRFEPIYMHQTVSSIDLQVGDIVVDQVTGNIGVLVERVLLTNNGVDDALALWAWEMYWIGANVPPGERSNMWTEFGLESIIKTGTYRYHRS